MYLRQHSQQEQIENEKIERRRREHRERLERISKERNLKMGMDYDYLRQQVAEKKEREAAEKEEDMAYQRRFLEEQKLLAKLSHQEKVQLRQIEQETNDFRRNYQRRDQEREYDITRPDYKYVNPPVRVTDNDPWLSVSSCQKMDGEDLSCNERRSRQRDQLERWQQQQIAEKRNRWAKENEEQKEWERRYQEADDLSVEIGEREKMARYQWQQDIIADNARLAQQKRQREAEERQNEIDYNMYEIEETTRHPVTREIGASYQGSKGRMVTQDYKRMTPDCIADVKQTQLRQISEAERIKQEKIELERAQDEDFKIATRNAIKQSRQLERDRIALQRKTAEENLALAKQKEEERKRKIINQPTDEFWKYFGESHR